MKESAERGLFRKNVNRNYSLSWPEVPPRIMAHPLRAKDVTIVSALISYLRIKVLYTPSEVITSI